MTAAVISASVWMLSSQRPRRAKETNAKRVISPARRPPKRSTIRVLAAIMPTQVSHSKKSRSAVTSQSQKARNASSTAKNGFGALGALVEQPGLGVVQLARQLVPGERRRPGVLVLEEDVAEDQDREDPERLGSAAAEARGGRRERRRAQPAASYCHLRRDLRRCPAPPRWRAGSPRGRRCPPPCRPGRRAPAGPSRPPAGRRSALSCSTGSSGPSFASPGRGSRMIQRSVSTWVRGMSRMKFSTYPSAGEPTSSSGVPSCTIAPSRMIAMRSPSRSASGRSCVMKIIVFPVSVLEPDHLVLHVAADQRVERAERLVVEHQLGLDRERPREADALLHAAGELRRERGRHVVRGRRARASRSRASAARAFDTPWISRPKAALSITVRWASRPKCWNTIDTLCRRSSRSPAASEPVTSWSPILTVPAVGSISRISVRTSVDLPGARQAHDHEHLAGPDVDRDVADRGHAAGLLAELGARQIRVRRADDLVGVLAEQLPDALGAEQRLAVAIGGRGRFGGLHGSGAVRVTHGAMIYQAARALASPLGADLTWADDDRLKLGEHLERMTAADAAACRCRFRPGRRRGDGSPSSWSSR